MFSIIFIYHRENEFLFLPGVSCSEDVGFVMGQFIEQDGSTGFVKGQVSSRNVNKGVLFPSS